MIDKDKKKPLVRQALTARDGAVKVLYATLYEGGYSNIELKNLLKAYDMEKRERAFCTELVYGVLQSTSMLDFYIESYSKTSLKKIEPYIKIILEMGIYQILYLDKVPQTAACDEGVKLAKKYNKKNSAIGGFVNGLLREVARNKENLPKLNEKTKEAYLAKFYSLPLWLVELWIAQYGMERGKKLCADCNVRRDTVVRVNTLKTTKAEVMERLAAQEIFCEEIEGLANGLKIKYTGDMGTLDLYKEGFLMPQDIGSQVAVDILSPKMGETVIDMCSAPGGKAMLMAQYMKNDGAVLAFDLHPHKREIIKKNKKRMGAEIVTAQCGDMTEPMEELLALGDKVLCDVPCSGLGIIAKKPDIRLKAQEDIKALPPIQYAILKNAMEYVKIGGEVLYSTCTLNKSENEDIIARALLENPRFSLCEITSSYHNIHELGMVTLFPHEYESDGFFICKVRRNS